jgi:sugar phosphate isomerase/epimerase
LDIAGCVRDFANRIKHVHLKDAWVDPELQQDVGMIHGASAVHGIPGPACHIDFAALFRELAEAGYRGPVTLDLRPSTEESVRMAADYLRPLLEPWRGCIRSSNT